MGGLRSRVGGRRLALPNYSRNVYLILLYTLGKGFQIYIGQVTTNLYAYSLGYPKDFIGVIAAMPAIGALVAAIPVGLLADRIGRKPLLLISGVLNPVALVAIGLSTSAPSLLVASFFNGVFASAYWVTILPILTESTERRSTGWRAGDQQFSATGRRRDWQPDRRPHPRDWSQPSSISLRSRQFRCVSVCWRQPLSRFCRFSRCSRLMSCPSPRRRARAAPGCRSNRRRPCRPQPAPAPQRMERKALVVLFAKLLLPDILATTGEGTVLGLLQLYFVLKFQMQPGSLGAFFTLAGLIGGATALNAPRIVRRWGKLKTATTMQYLSAPAMLLTGFAPVLPLAAAGEFSRIVLRGLFDPTYASFTMDQVSSRYRATLSGFYSVTWSARIRDRANARWVAFPESRHDASIYRWRRFPGERRDAAASLLW